MGDRNRKDALLIFRIPWAIATSSPIVSRFVNECAILTPLSLHYS
jgi:hypothetical protein